MKILFFRMLISCIYHGYEGIAAFKRIYLCEIIVNASKPTEYFVRFYFGLANTFMCSFRVFFVSYLQCFSLALLHLLLLFPFKFHIRLNRTLKPIANLIVVFDFVSVFSSTFHSLFTYIILPCSCSQSSCTPYPIQSKFFF